MRTYRVLESIFQFFFPLEEKMKLNKITPTRDFDFKVFQSVQIYALRYLEEKNSSYLLVFLPTKLGNLDLPINSKLSQSRMNDLGRLIQKIEVVNGGQKNLSSPPTQYLEEKWVLEWGCKSKIVYTIIPTDFLIECTHLFGFSYIRELYAENLKESPEKSLENFENSILYSRCQFFENPLTYPNSLEKKFLSNLLSELLSKKLLSYNHIASLHLFYGRKINLPDHLPREIQNVVLRLSSTIQPFLLSSNKGKYRWKRKLDYYFQNVLSVLLLEKGSSKIMYDTSKLDDFYFSINEHRLSILNTTTTAPQLIESLVKKGKVKELISNEGMDLLVSLSAHGEKLPLKVLFQQFKGSFQSEFNFKVQSHKMKLKKIKEYNKKKEYTSLKLHFLQFLEFILLKKYDNSFKSNLSTSYIYEVIRDLPKDKMCQLYNTLGFEAMAELYQGLKFKENSPIQKEEADVFFLERNSLLPTVEREIVEDIYFERLNADKILNDDVIEKDFQEVSRRIAVFEEIRGIKKS
jgi:hypothetical protein